MMKSISNSRELKASIAKLAILEAELRRVKDAETNPTLRHAIEISLARLVNQFKEEIQRYRPGDGGERYANRVLRTPQEAENTRRKLEAVEALLETKAGQPAGPVTRLSTRSMRRMRNKLREELLSYEARSREAQVSRATIEK